MSSIIEFDKMFQELVCDNVPMSPVSLVNGTTYLVTVENGIGDVVSLSH